MLPRVLVISDYYLPGFKGGGPIRTLANIVEHLGDEFSFKVLTRNRDLGDKNPYPGIESGYMRVGKAEVLYMAPGQLTFSGIAWRINEAAPDIIYLNSFFSPYFALIPRILSRFGRIPQTPTIIAPRGEFARSALKIKPLKKKSYLFLTKRFGFFESVIWQASGEHEAADIRRNFPYAKVIVAPDLLPLLKKVGPDKKPDKKRGSLKIVFLSRISHMKNLHGALQILHGLDQGDIVFDIWGPIGDNSYWKVCGNLLRKLPGNIKATYRGAVSPELVHDVLCRYDVFFLPTLGENFGHVILEALGAGLPVIISDRTQWKNLTINYAGWDIPLDDIAQFTQVLSQCVNMDAEELDKWFVGAKNYASSFYNVNMWKEKAASLFLECLRAKQASS